MPAGRHRHPGGFFWMLLLLVAGAATGCLSSGPTTRFEPNGGYRAPPIEIIALDAHGRHLVDLHPVLGTTVAGTPLTARALLTFDAGRSVIVRQALIVVVKPGIGPGVGTPGDVDGLIRRNEVARGTIATTSAPHPVVLTVTASGALRPGHYPVLCFYRTAPLPADPDAYHAGDSGLQIGSVIVT